MLPFALGGALVALISGQILSRLGDVRSIMWFAWTVITLGFGLMIQLDDRSNKAEKELYPLVAAIGIGCLFAVPLIGLQSVMPLKDIATSTGAFGFLRLLGGTIGISIAQAILSSTLRKKISKIPGLTFDTSPAALSQGVRQLQNIPDPTQRAAVIHAYSKSVSEIWLVMTPILGAGLLMVLTLSKTGFKRQGAPPAPTTAPASVEPKPEAARTSDLENGFEKTADVDSNTASTSAAGADEEVAFSQNAVLSTSTPEAKAETV